jgi:hypothetical protein
MSKTILKKILDAALQFGRRDIEALCFDRSNDFLLTWQATTWGILPVKGRDRRNACPNS